MKDNDEIGDLHGPMEATRANYNHDSQVYINNPYELQQLKNDPLIRDFANVTPDTYELIKATNPYLLMFVDLAKRIMEAEG